MRQHQNQSIAALLALCLTFFAGCSLNSPVDELYSLPQMPHRYADLESKINDLLAEGAEYATPSSGNNLQTVQMVDLNNDGQEEALLFMRNNAEEHPLRIYIFRMEGEEYRECATIEGTGSTIYSVNYSDLTGDGLPELIVGFRTGAEAQMLSVYSMKSFVPQLLLSTAYARYHITADGGMVLFHSDKDGVCLAEHYTADGNGQLGICSSLRLSCTAAELAAGRIVRGKTSDGTDALFVTGISSDYRMMSVDLLTREGEILKNTAVDASTGYTSVFCPYIGLFPTDIDGDGVTEIPFAAETGDSGVVTWRRYDSDGRSHIVEKTFHSMTDGWYLVLTEAIKDGFTATRTESTGGSETAMSFSYPKNGEDRECFRIYTFSGENRELRGKREGRFVLRSLAQTVYAGEVTDAQMGIDEDGLREAFRLIETEWLSGEN